MYGPEWKDEQIERLLTAASTIPTGNPWLDDVWAGGINNRQSILVGAKTGVGKTFFGTQLAYHAAKAGKNVVYFALEADAHEIERRMLYYAMLRVILKHLPNGKMPRYRAWLQGEGYQGEELNMWLRLEEEAKRELNIHLGSFRAIYRTDQYEPKQFYEEIERLAEGGMEKPQLIVLDHLHHFFMHGDEMDGLKLAIHGIRRAQDKHGIPIVTLCQLRKTDRGGKNNTKTLPNLEDMRGTSALTDVATDVLIISPVPQELHDQLPLGTHHPMFFHLAKSRTAPEGKEFVAAMGFDGKAGAYSPRYALFRARQWDDPEVVGPMEIPDWAKCAARSAVNSSYIRRPDIRGSRRDDD